MVACYVAPLGWEEATNPRLRITGCGRHFNSTGDPAHPPDRKPKPVQCICRRRRTDWSMRAAPVGLAAICSAFATRPLRLSSSASSEASDWRRSRRTTAALSAPPRVLIAMLPVTELARRLRSTPSDRKNWQTHWRDAPAFGRMRGSNEAAAHQDQPAYCSDPVDETRTLTSLQSLSSSSRDLSSSSRQPPPPPDATVFPMVAEEAPPDAEPPEDPPADAAVLERPPGAPRGTDDPPLDAPENCDDPPEDGRSLSKNDDPPSPGSLRTLRPPELAMAVDVSDVDKSRVTAGDVTTANLPQACKNCLLSSSSLSCRPIASS